MPHMLVCSAHTGPCFFPTLCLPLLLFLSSPFLFYITKDGTIVVLLNLISFTFFNFEVTKLSSVGTNRIFSFFCELMRWEVWPKPSLKLEFSHFLWKTVWNEKLIITTNHLYVGFSTAEGYLVHFSIIEMANTYCSCSRCSGPGSKVISRETNPSRRQNQCNPIPG